MIEYKHTVKCLQINIFCVKIAKQKLTTERANYLSFEIKKCEYDPSIYRYANSYRCSGKNTILKSERIKIIKKLLHIRIINITTVFPLRFFLTIMGLPSTYRIKYESNLTHFTQMRAHTYICIYLPLINCS